MSIGIFTAPKKPRPQPPRSTGKPLTGDERIIEAVQDAGRVTATNRVEPGNGSSGPVPVSRSDQKRRPEQSPLYRLAVLLAKTYRQPGRMPTAAQAAELERLCVEAEQMMEYRRAHPDWPREGRWI